MERFRVRAMEIVRSSKNPEKCLQWMQVKARTILGSDVFAGGGACCLTEFSLPPQGALVSSGEGIKPGKNWVTDGADEAAAAATLPAGVHLVVPGVVDPGWRHGGAPQIEPDADVPGVEVVLGASDNTFDDGSDCSVWLCGINEKLPLFHGSVDWIIRTNPVSIRLHYIQSEEITEMDQILAGKFTNMDSSRIYPDHTVLVEEEPEPGGTRTPRIGLTERKEETDSTAPANQVIQENTLIKQEKPQDSKGKGGKLLNRSKRIKQGSCGSGVGEIGDMGGEDGTGKGMKCALGEDPIAGDGENKKARPNEGVEVVKMVDDGQAEENTRVSAGLPGQPCGAQ